MIDKGIILLSGGLDSLISLDIASKTIDIKLALIFDYGQRVFREEKKAAISIAKYYNLEYKVIKIPYIKDISHSHFFKEGKKISDDFNAIWVPNRNGLFLNIAACYCEALKYNTVIFGANKKEAIQFPDNSKPFVDFCNKTFEYSTLNKVKVYAPCLQFDKIEIINYAIDNNLPLKLIKSCYNLKEETGKKHCGKCMSCKLLHEAILKSKNPKLAKEIFDFE